MSIAPTLSILLPVYNGGQDLLVAVKSLLAQTVGDFEILLIDDGSSDDAVAKVIANGDARIVILGDRQRRGLSARLNEGIGKARGQYIARMDADDVALPSRLQKQIEFLNAHPEVDLLACRAALFDETGIVGLLPFAASHDDICASPWRGFPMPHPTWVGRADYFRRYRYAIPEVMRAEDQDLLLRSYRQSRFACLDEILIGYRLGKFSWRKNFMARWHLWRAQKDYFLQHKEWNFFMRATVVFGIRLLADLVSVIPCGRQLVLSRLKKTVSQNDLPQLQALTSIIKDIYP